MKSKQKQDATRLALETTPLGRGVVQGNPFAPLAVRGAPGAPSLGIGDIDFFPYDYPYITGVL